MNITDQKSITPYANTNNDLDAIIVIYDPDGSNAFGGGWFSSPTGALTRDTSPTGKASYGFTVNYRNAAKPKGETQVEFKVGSFEFNALNFDYLSVNDAKAQFRGTGKIIGGQNGIGFIMTVKDGAIDGSNIDKIRMKIYIRNTGYVYYDNQPGAGDADEPETVVGTNSEIVIRESATSAASAISRETMEVNTSGKITGKLQLIAYPNPGNKDFTIHVKTNDLKTIFQMLVFEQQVRLLEKRDRMAAGSLLKIGEKFRPGIYYIRIVQGLQHSELKLVKLSE